MATLTAKNPSWSQSETRTVMSTVKNLIDGAATWKASQFLRRASDGLMYEANSSVTSVPTSAITHYALSDLDATLGADTTYGTFGVVHADDEFEIHELDGTVTAAMMGQQFEMDKGTNLCTVDTGTNTVKILQLVEPFWRNRQFQDTSADTLARALVKVLTVAIEAAPAS